MTRRTLVVSLLALAMAVGAPACRSKPELPELGRLADFSLVAESGSPAGSKELRGKVWVAAFMFTRCPTVCPRITRRMRELQLSAQSKNLPLQFVSFSVDPEHDTPDVLRKYAEDYQANLSSWSFLTGDYEVVKKTAVDGFKMALEGKANPAAEDFGILHGSHLVLVDEQLAIRGYYRTSDDTEMARLLDDAARLAG